MKHLLLPLVLVLAATGCASTAPTAAPMSEAPATATPTPTVMGPGEYEFQPVSGGTGTLSIPGKPSAELEALRAIVKAPPVTYLTASVDNREGTETINMYGVSIFTPEGEELKYTGIDTYAGELQDMLPDTAPAEVYNRFNKSIRAGQEAANPLGKKDFVLVGPAVPEKITGVKVYPTGGFDPVDALPKS